MPRRRSLASFAAPDAAFSAAKRCDRERRTDRRTRGRSPRRRRGAWRSGSRDATKPSRRLRTESIAITGADVTRLDGPESAELVGVLRRAPGDLGGRREPVRWSAAACGPRDTATLATGHDRRAGRDSMWRSPYSGRVAGLGQRRGPARFRSRRIAGSPGRGAVGPARSGRHSDDPGRAASLETRHRRLGTTPRRVRRHAVAAPRIRSHSGRSIPAGSPVFSRLQTRRG